MSDDFLEDFDKFSGFEPSGGFGGMGSGAFDFDAEDEMKHGLTNTDKKKVHKLDSQNAFQFDNPLSLADDLGELKSMEESKGGNLLSNILDFNPKSHEDRNRKSSSPNVSNFLQVPGSATKRNQQQPTTNPPKESPRTAQKPKDKEVVKNSPSQTKPSNSKNSEKTAIPATKQQKPSPQSTKNAPDAPKKTNTPNQAPKASPNSTGTKPIAPISTSPSQPKKDRPTTAAPTGKSDSQKPIEKTPLLKDKANLPGITLTRPEIPKLEIDPLLISEEDKKIPNTIKPAGTKLPDTKEVKPAPKAAEEDFAEFDDFEGDFADIQGDQALPEVKKNNGTATKEIKNAQKPAAIDEPTDQQIGGFDTLGELPAKDEKADKKNKFLNVHEANDDFDEDFGFASNAISDQVGSEVPKVNLDNSGVSNRNFDEKMISTVNSEQVESRNDQKSKNAEETQNKTSKKAMDGIKEVSGDNSNSANKASSNNRRPAKDPKTGSDSPVLEEPLNQPTFLENSNEVKPNFKVQPRGAEAFKQAAAAAKQTVTITTVKKPGDRPQSSTGGSQAKKPNINDPPPKKARLPDFGLKPQKPPKQVTAATLLAQAGVEEAKTQKDDFGALLATLTNQVKKDLKENEEKKDVKVFKPKKDIEVQRELLEKERVQVMKDFLGKAKLDEEERRKKEIEEAKLKLDEFKKQNGIQYPKVKTKPKPSVVEPPKPADPPKDLIAEANNFIRAGAWKKKKPEGDKKASEGDETSKPGSPDGLFEVAEKEEGVNNMPEFKAPTNRGPGTNSNTGKEEGDELQPSPNLENDFDPDKGDIGLANLPENNSEGFFGAIPNEMQPVKSSKPGTKKVNVLMKSQNLTEKEKKAVFENFKQKEADRQKRAEEAIMIETWDKKVKETKKAAVEIENNFRIAQDLEQKEKRERLDKYSQGHVTLRHGKQEPEATESKAEGKPTKYSEFRLRSGAGVQGLLTIKEDKNEMRDIKFRALEVAKAHELKKLAAEREKELFKERLNKEKDFLKERARREQEHLRVLQAEKVKKKKGEDKKEDENQAKPTVNAFYEESVEGEQAPIPTQGQPEQPEGQNEAGSGPHLKLKHSLKLKAFLQKLAEINQGMISQLKQRDKEYEQLRKEYEAMAIRQRKEDDKERRAIVESALEKVPMMKLFDLLRGDSSLIRTNQIGRQLRDNNTLSLVEKKTLKELLSSAGQDLLTYNQFELILKENEVQDNLKIAKGAAEIEEDRKLAKFLHQLEDYSEKIEDFNKVVDSRACDSFDAYNNIMVLKKEQLSYMAAIPQMMEGLSKRLNSMISSMNKQEDDDKFLVGFEEVEKANKDKLYKLQNIYQDALRDFDETDSRLKNLQLFDVKDFEELERKEKTLASTAFAAIHSIHNLNFEQKNKVLNFIAFLGKEKKSALMIQSWYRGWKARKIYGKKKTFRQRLWYLANRWIKRFYKRSATKMIPELLDSFYRAKTHMAFHMINRSNPIPAFKRELSELTIKMLSSRLERRNFDKVEFNISYRDSLIQGDQALPGMASMRSSMGSIHKDVKAQSESSLHISEVYDEANQGRLSSIDGKSVFYAIILQRFYRYYRKKLNPEVFFVTPSEAINRCRLCNLDPVKVILPENHVCLYCLSCFSELNETHKRTKQFRLLKINPRMQKPLSDMEKAERVLIIYKKISKLRDFSVLCKAWDFDGTGLIHEEDLELLVGRLKMITQTEKNLLLKFSEAFQSGGQVDYREIIGSLQR
jgi:hypothetical protein